MDIFNLMISLLLIFLALQYGQNWIVFAVLVISVITMKELPGTLALLGGAAVIYILYNGVEFDSLFIFVVFKFVYIIHSFIELSRRKTNSKPPILNKSILTPSRP